jgi:hypothetical protein
VGLVLRRGRESVRGRKGGGRRPSFIWTEREGRGSGRGVAAGDLAIDGWRAKRRKEQEEGGNGK